MLCRDVRKRNISMTNNAKASDKRVSSCVYRNMNFVLCMRYGCVAIEVGNKYWLYTHSLRWCKWRQHESR